MKLVFIFLVSLLCEQSEGQYAYGKDILAVSDVMRNTFQIKTDSGYATAFVVQKNEKEFLITARHVFKKSDYLQAQITIDVNIQKKWQNFICNFSLPKDSTVDIVVLKLNRSLATILEPLEIAAFNEFHVGQDCVFLGFPFNRFRSETSNENVPFVKKALVSSVMGKTTFLDGLNNPGFSGGPVVIWCYEHQKPMLLGVISGYYPQKDKLNIEVSKKKKEMFYNENSGIIYSFGLYNIIDILK